MADLGEEKPMPSTPDPSNPTPTTPTTPVSSGPELSADVHAEIDAAMAKLEAMSAPTRAAAAHAPVKLRGPRVVQAGREHRTGAVVTVGPTDVFIEFGPKELGILPRAQFKEGEALPEPGTQIQVVIDKFEAAESIYLCSRPGAVQKADWERLTPGDVVDAKVTGVTKGGLELEVAGHRAFMPASQVSAERIDNLDVLIGEKMACEVVRVERAGSGNIVLSRRNVLQRERAEHAAKLKETLQEGQTIEGTVRKIMPFGAFVDLGGVDGLVHLSDLTYDRVGYGEKAVEKHLKEGQKVTVKILKLDWEANRISLGVKQLMGDPFTTAANAIIDGAELTGKITKLAEFGAFVEVAPGVEGLVHISELDHKRVMRVEDVVKPDEVVQVKVLKVDPQSRRISLSIKALKPLPEVNIGGGGGGGGGPGRGLGGGGKGKDRGGQSRTPEEIKKETPELRRLREKYKNFQFKGGLS